MDDIKTPVLTEGDAADKRQEIKEYFNRTYSLYESLFNCLSSDSSYFERPEPLRHPLIFYFGHTSVFYINKLNEAGLLEDRLDEKLEAMLAVGVDEMSWDDLDETHYDWPTVDGLREYRDEARAVVNAAIDKLELRTPIQWDDPFWVIMMGIEHERIHLETSSVLIRQLELPYVREDEAWPVCPDTSGSALVAETRAIDGGRVRLGRDRPSRTYGWDNEFGTREVDVASFRARECLVSQEEFLRFVRDGGYEDSNWWSEEGWAWRSYKEAKSPPFWVADANTPDGFRYRTMTTEIDMPSRWPVEVNYHEAEAYCRWLASRENRDFRLPTEPEWYRMYEVCVDEDYPSWSGAAPGNVNLEHFASSCPVDMFRQGLLCDVIGNVWQWTSTPIDGFEGFEVHPVYDDFSTPTFDGRHNLIKGGSWISTGNEVCRESRYAFRRHFYQHAGFRYVESIA